MDKLDEFEAHRDHLRSVAYRMLGSASDADDALQEAWLRVARADTDDVRRFESIEMSHGGSFACPGR